VIYTVTLNPSIDHVIYMKEEVQLGGLNRMERDRKFPGGKGINVSRILGQLGIDNVALGYVGGFTGRFIEDWLHEEGIRTHFTQVEEDTRINVKVKSDVETEINGQGPFVSEDLAQSFLKELASFSEDDVVVLAGSKPSSLPSDYYQTIIKQLANQGTQFVIDTTGQELKDALASHPLVVKPNHHELEELFDVVIEKDEDVIPYGKKLVELGAKHAIISMAEKGAILFTPEGIYHGKAPKGELKNSVGSGDSMIAGFVGTYQETKDVLEAFKVSIASGSATAFEEDLATKEKIEALLPQIEVRKLEEK
jgi:1-phosphofructokinase